MRRHHDDRRTWLRSSLCDSLYSEKYHFLLKRLVACSASPQVISAPLRVLCSIGAVICYHGPRCSIDFPFVFASRSETLTCAKTSFTRSDYHGVVAACSSQYPTLRFLQERRARPMRLRLPSR